jgi:hypothetical protein
MASLLLFNSQKDKPLVITFNRDPANDSETHHRYFITFASGQCLDEDDLGFRVVDGNGTEILSIHSLETIKQDNGFNITQDEIWQDLDQDNALSTGDILLFSYKRYGLFEEGNGCSFQIYANDRLISTLEPSFTAP